MDIPDNSVHIDGEKPSVVQGVPQDNYIPDNGVKLDSSVNIPDNEVELDKPTSKYGTVSQQALAGVEGAERGLTAGMSDAAFKYMHQMGEDTGLREWGQKELGLGPNWVAPDIKDVAGRQEENPVTSRGAEAAGILLGVTKGMGAPGLIEKGTAALVPQATTAMGKIGSAALKTAIGAGLFQSGDEISNAMLGKGDPEAPVSAALAHIGAATLLGGLTGGLLNVTGQAANKGLQTLENAKMGTRAKNLMTGMGVAAKMKELGLSPEQAEEYINNVNEGNNKSFGKDWFNSLKPKSSIPSTTPEFADTELNYKDIKKGLDLFNKGLSTAATGLGGVAGGAAGSITGIPGGIAGERAGEKFLGPLIEGVLGKVVSKSNKYVIPTIMKQLSEGKLNDLLTTIDYANKVAKGNSMTNKAIDGLFKVGGQQLYDHTASDRDFEKLNDYLDKGGLNEELTTQSPPQFAEGGEVGQQPTDHFAEVYPDQSQLLGAAKARVFTYLNSKRPQQNQSPFPYDKIEPDKTQEKSFRRAADIANSPLSIFNHIKDGTIDQEHVQHLTSMYPEVYKNLSNKIMERIVNNKIDDEQPSYKVRQGLSLLLGKPMESTFAPFQIQQAQSVYIKPMPNQQDKSKGRPTQLKDKSTDLNKTPEQAAEQDQAKRG